MWWSRRLTELWWQGLHLTQAMQRGLRDRQTDGNCPDFVNLRCNELMGGKRIDGWYKKMRVFRHPVYGKLCLE